MQTIEQAHSFSIVVIVVWSFFDLLRIIINLLGSNWPLLECSVERMDHLNFAVVPGLIGSTAVTRESYELANKCVEEKSFPRSQPVKSNERLGDPFTIDTFLWFAAT